MTTLEENSGGDGNSSVSELEVRVESLENATIDQETRLSAAEANIEGIGVHFLTEINYDICQENTLKLNVEHESKFLSLCCTI